MTPVKFDSKRMSDFRVYAKVRKSGRYNMLDPRAQKATGLSREDFMYVLENFESLQAQHRGKTHDLAYTGTGHSVPR